MYFLEIEINTIEHDQSPVSMRIGVMSSRGYSYCYKRKNQCCHPNTLPTRNFLMKYMER